MKRTHLSLALLAVLVPVTAQARGGFIPRYVAGAVAPRHKSPRLVRIDPLMVKLDRKLDRQGGRGIDQRALRTTSPKANRTLAPYFADPSKTGEGVEGLPLQSTSAKVTITGVIAQVQVEQVYRNRGTKPIEALYVFPASTRAAVHGMKMIIGKRVITAEIQKRKQARATYNQARQQGRRAALLEQQRSNVFTMQVANIMPGETVRVRLDYSELLVPEDHTYEFVYPVVVGPRNGLGANQKTDRWLANPYLKQGKPVPYRFDIKVHVASPIGIKALTSPSHQVNVQFASRNDAKVTLKSQDQGNRDFVLRYRLASDRIQAGVMTYEHGGEQFFLAMVEPPKRVRRANIPSREYVFVLDVSGSMYGFPLDTAKQLITNLIGSLRASDHFNVILFAGRAAVLFPKSVAATRNNVSRALALINQQRGGGGTDLMSALKTAYGLPKPERHVSRSIVVITDGYVAVEGKAFRFIRKRLSHANCFAFGIGSSVNRAIIEGMARAGMGEPFVVLSGSEAQSTAKRFRKYIDSPVLTDIHVRFEGLAAYDVSPKSVPDLMASRPLVLFGKYRGHLQGRIVITGQTGRGAFNKSLDMSSISPSASNAPIRVLWARKWVADLSDQLAALPGDRDVVAAITNLGLNYNLLTRYTSFVATDTKIVNRSGKMVSVRQVLPLPKGVSNLAVSGGIGANPLTSLGGGGYYGSGRMRRGRVMPLRAVERTRLDAPSGSPKVGRKHISRMRIRLANVSASRRARARMIARRLMRLLPANVGQATIRLVWLPSKGTVSIRVVAGHLSRATRKSLERRLAAKMRRLWNTVHRLASNPSRPVVIRVSIR